MSIEPKKNKLNKGFSSFDLITTILAIAIVAAIIVPIFYKSAESRNLAIVNQELVEIAENLTIHREKGPVNSSESSARLPASEAPKWEGMISKKDPWEQSYNYKVIRDAYGLASHVIVWSKGANGIQDTPDSELTLVDGTIRLRSDDIGYVKEIR